jgi:hypothetical protein
VKIYLLIVSVILSGCVAYPAYYPTSPVVSDPNHAQAVANEQCSKSGKVAVKIQSANCNNQNCTTAFECR